MADLPEILFTQSEQSCTIKLGVPSHVVVCVGVQSSSPDIFPDFLCVVLALKVDETRIPIGFLTRDIIASFQEQDPLPGWSQRVAKSSSTRSGADNDDVEFILCIHNSWPVATVVISGNLVSFDHLLKAATLGSGSSRVDVAGDRRIMKCTKSLEKSKSSVQSKATRTFFSSLGSLVR